MLAVVVLAVVALEVVGPSARARNERKREKEKEKGKGKGKSPIQARDKVPYPRLESDTFDELLPPPPVKDREQEAIDAIDNVKESWGDRPLPGGVWAHDRGPRLEACGLPPEASDAIDKGNWGYRSSPGGVRAHERGPRLEACGLLPEASDTLDKVKAFQQKEDILSTPPRRSIKWSFDEENIGTLDVKASDTIGKVTFPSAPMFPKFDEASHTKNKQYD